MVPTARARDRRTPATAAGLERQWSLCSFGANQAPRQRPLGVVSTVAMFCLMSAMARAKSVASGGTWEQAAKRPPQPSAVRPPARRELLEPTWGAGWCTIV